MSCSICLDTFRNPKLLPCLHTFCRKCLENHAKCKIQNGQVSKLKCPLCRHIVCIPPNGINTIFQNYFVKDSRHDPENICDDCNTSVMNICCHLCDDFLCSDCKRHHRCEFTETELVLSDSESNIEDETEVLIQRLLLLNSNSPATKIEADVVGKFSVCNDSINIARATSILPLHQGGALVVINQGPDVIHFDRHYKKKETIKVGFGIRDIVHGPNGRIYLLQDTTSSILELCGRRVRWFCFLPCQSPTAMSFFPDGRSVVVGFKNAAERFNRNKTINEQGRVPQMILVRSDGVVSDVLKLYLLFPTGVVIIPEMNIICISDITYGYVAICLSDGTYIGHYGLRNPPSPSDISSEHPYFLPRGLCCDRDGNIVVYDQVSGSVHLIDSSGHLVALVNTKSPLGLGSPGTIRVAQDGKLWVGDSESSTIRILKNNKFKNSLYMSL